MKIILSGGGTGGHIYPALAIKETIEAEKTNTEFGYIGVTGGMEDKIVSKEPNIKFMGVSAQGMPRKLSLQWFSFPFVNLKGVFSAFRYLKKFKPDLVVTTGGFVAFPVLAASKILGIPVVMHEQNAAMGVTNKFFINSAKKVLLTYDSAAKADGKRIVVTGNPVRKTFFYKNDDEINNSFIDRNYEYTIAVVGGSRGALSLNKACIELSKNWLPKNKNIRLLHISGERDYEMVKEATKEHSENYVLLKYCHNMKDIFDASDLLISRAGATILAEISVCRKPAILVPFPYATDNHQEKNARVLEELNAAKVLLDKDMNYESLTSLLKELLNKDILSKMSDSMKGSRPDNVELKIYNEIMATMSEL